MKSHHLTNEHWEESGTQENHMFGQNSAPYSSITWRQQRGRRLTSASHTDMLVWREPSTLWFVFKRVLIAVATLDVADAPNCPARWTLGKRAWKFSCCQTWSSSGKLRFISEDVLTPSVSFSHFCSCGWACGWTDGREKEEWWSEGDGGEEAGGVCVVCWR